MNFRSQKGQDKWVVDIFDYKKNGYFVDLAASDGTNNSNTYVLEKQLGWSGICIEPNPQFFEVLKKTRKCCINDVIDETFGIVNFRIDNGELGGIVAADTDNNYEIRGQQLTESTIIKKKTKTLESVLDKMPNTIDYLSLDVEGSELRVLRKFPFHRYRFLAMTIERPPMELEKILFANNYFFVKAYNFDTFYVHKSIPGFDKIEKKPYIPTPKKDW